MKLNTAQLIPNLRCIEFPQILGSFSTAKVSSLFLEYGNYLQTMQMTAGAGVRCLTWIIDNTLGICPCSAPA